MYVHRYEEFQWLPQYLTMGSEAERKVEQLNMLNSPPKGAMKQLDSSIEYQLNGYSFFQNLRQRSFLTTRYTLAEDAED